MFLKEILLNKWDFRPTAASTSLRLIVGNLIYSDRSLPALFFVRIPTVFQHCMRAPLLCSSTFLHAFLLFLSTFLCAHPYCTPALSACIPTMFKHFLACISIFTCARSCRIPALPHAENYPKVSCISITVPLHFHYSSITFPLHFLHFFSSISFPLHFFSSTSCFQLPS